MSLRNWLLARAARRLAGSGNLPETIERDYRTATEYRQDSPRLEAIGYEVYSESDTADPLPESDSFPRYTGSLGIFGRIRPVRRRRLPSYHIIYRLRSAP